ncbi:RING-H2 finger protein ATL72-like [Actinidia eriantha]|uniref:RING-H2 finger protein ATL72-like n=1 Tax=Actinidia eriantha TaxID=165200 RepID=UPI00258F931C|nr:RING-H2 finger protein ATL72-like [Actinidia eriantha]
MKSQPGLLKNDSKVWTTSYFDISIGGTRTRIIPHCFGVCESVRPTISSGEYVLMSNLYLHLHHHPHRHLLDEDPTAPPANGGRTRGSYSAEANFDTNMVIILAALLCALICALGLNSIVRCALRCTRRFTFETQNEADARLAATGLKKSTLHQIPVAVYGSGMNIPAMDCPICLGEFMDGEKVRVLPKCHHGFHVRCIDMWLAAHSSCPTCRQSLVEQQISSADAADGEVGLRPGNESGGHGDASGSAEEVG